MQRLILLCFLIIPFVINPAKVAWAQADSPQQITASFKYPGLIVSQNDKAKMSFIISNNTAINQVILIKVISSPNNWETELKHQGNLITGLSLAAKEKEELTLDVFPPNNTMLPLGEHEFVLKIENLDNNYSQDIKTTLKVINKRNIENSLKLSSPYPVLSGGSEQRFSFYLILENNDHEETLVSFKTNQPPKWDLAFKAEYDDKQISSLLIRAAEKRQIALEISPPKEALIGDYPIKITALNSSGLEAETLVTVNLTGTYKIRMATNNGLLSSNTQIAKPVNISIYLRNDGSALQKEINFITVKPENWDVKFSPEKIENLPGNGGLAQVEMTITPGSGALLGDYLIGITANGEKTLSELDFRITVKGSATWGMLGLALILTVVTGLSLTFYYIGRR